MTKTFEERIQAVYPSLSRKQRVFLRGPQPLNRPGVGLYTRILRVSCIKKQLRRNKSKIKNLALFSKALRLKKQRIRDLKAFVGAMEKVIAQNSLIEDKIIDFTKASEIEKE